MATHLYRGQNALASHFGHVFTARQQSAVLAMIDSVRPSDRPSDRPSQSGIMPKRLQLRSSLEDSPMILVS